MVENEVQMIVDVTRNEDSLVFVFTAKSDDFSTITVKIPRTLEGPTEEFLDLVYSMDQAFDGALEELELKYKSEAEETK